MNLDYANARAHGSRARLLGPEGLTTVLSAGGVRGRLTVMAQLLPELRLSPALSASDLLAAAEHALSAAFSRDARRAAVWLGDTRSRDRLAAAFAFEEAWLLEAIFRGLARGEPATALLSRVLPTPALPEEELAALARVGEPKGAADLLASWSSPWAEAASRGVAPLAKGDAAPLTAALSETASRIASEAVRGPGEDARLLRDHFARGIDLGNVRTLLLPLEAPDAAKLFRPGGRELDRETFLALSRMGLPERARGLAEERDLFLPLKIGAALLSDPFLAEEALRAVEEKAMAREALDHPLSLAVTLAWLLARRGETRRLRLLLRGTEFGMSDLEISRLMEAA